MKQKSKANAVAEQKRRKIHPPPSRGTVSPPGPRTGNPPPNPISTSTATKPQTSIINQKIQQAKNFAVAQAQHDGSTGNFRIFDSPFGNYLVPVVPTRAELGG
ncbi:hypothetical protein Tsubulata_028165 [Turnera subulata]|uniref:Uncharacterized protein n=1 Tax=Turnera subulata TaxID=218843 RepID=A0A9Q0FRI6_9ROSI|nr:hypothetical protein Tsubulata_028165 [Turnera subulata]